MQKKFRSILVGLSVFPAIAFAQFSTDVSGGGGIDTKLSIKQAGPGSAELTFTGVNLVYLNHDPKIAGVTPKKDVSGKGQVWIVSPETAAVPGLEICLSGIGRGGWAVVGGKVDHALVKCVPAASEVTLSITVDGTPGQCFGLTPLAVKDGVVVKDLWISHPGGQTKQLVTRANKATDMVTVLCLNEKKAIVPPTDAQAKVYREVYTKVTAAE